MTDACTLPDPVVAPEAACASPSLVAQLCFMQGTLIATPYGWRAVQDIVAGDEVCTAHGGVTVVTGVVHQAVAIAEADPLRVLPVRIVAGALGHQMPRRDLLLSPCHAVLLDDVLVQAGALVNGQSILRDDSVPESFVYCHLKTPEHTLLLADGVAAESVADHAPCSARGDWDEFIALLPEGAGVIPMSLPRVTHADSLPLSLAERIAARAIELSGEASQIS